MGWFDFLFGKSKTSGDGSSPAQAVIVNGIAEEYQWVRTHCPGFEAHQQALTHIDGKPYDVLKLRNEAGEERTVFFDISSFFGH